MTTGLCACGCGGRTSLAPHSCASRGMVRGQPLRFMHGHAKRNTGTARRATPKGYVYLSMPDHPNSDHRGRVYEHVLVASKALGKAIPKGAVVHHVNGLRGDNRPENLVICENEAYHKLIHARMKARGMDTKGKWRQAPEASHA